MKNFIFAVFIWFLVQLVLSSIIGNIKAVSGSYYSTREQCIKDTSPIAAGIIGASMPITRLTFIKGGWCWEK